MTSCKEIIIEVNGVVHYFYKTTEKSNLLLQVAVNYVSILDNRYSYDYEINEIQRLQYKTANGRMVFNYEYNISRTKM